MKRLRIKIIICLVIFITMFFVAYYAFKPSDKITIKSVSGLPKQSFTIDNQSEYIDRVDEGKFNSIKESLYKYIKVGENDSIQYHGNIRSNSYQKKQNNFGKEVIFIIDIPARKRSYKVSIGSGDDGSNIVYILCVNPDELIYPAFNCKDDVSEN